MLTNAQAAALRANLRGQLILPQDSPYDGARRVFNAMIDKRPAAIARCTGAADVVECVKFAREHGVMVSVRGGGHGVAGMAICNDGLVIDLSTMKTVRVDPKRRVARADPGVLLGEFDRETQAFGLATTMGTFSVTGIAGLTLGGGIGWLMGKHGFACDNLISADVVTADGQFLTASENENADLFWALRGGGGNFGVVTSFEYKLHEQGPVYAGFLAYPPEQFASVQTHMRDFAKDAPDEIALQGGVITKEGATMCVAVACYSGDVKKAEQVLKPLRAFGKPLVEQFDVMPYRVFQCFPDWWAEPNKQHYWRSGFFSELRPEALEVMTRFGLDKPIDRCGLGIEYLNGAVTRVPVDATAFAHRNARQNFLIFGSWDEPSQNEVGMRWSNELWQSMKPFIANRVYVNYMNEGESDRVASAYGENYQRLVTVKNKYDPSNFFRSNLSIASTKA